MRYFLGFLGLIMAITAVVIVIHPKIEFTNQADGFAYFVPLRSWLYDGDLNFTNENIYFEKISNGQMPYAWREKTETGKVVFPYSIGPALLWSPFYLLASQFVGHATGYETLLRMTLVVGSLTYGVLALVLTYLAINNGRVTTRPYNDSVTASVIIISLATPFYWYFFYQPLMSHILSAFAVSLLLFLYLRRSNFVLLGLALGLITLIRWQDGLFGIIVIAAFIDRRSSIISTIKDIVWAFLGFIAAFSLQMLAWRDIYGHFLLIPQGSNFFNLTNPHLLVFLFSFRHGLFTWSPIVIFSVAGLILLAFSRSRQQKVLAISSFLVLSLEIYLCAAVSDWHGSDSFGARRLVSFMPLFIVGLAYFYRNLKNSLWHRLFIVVVILLTVYNVFLAFGFSNWYFDHFSAVYPSQVTTLILESLGKVCIQ